MAEYIVQTQWGGDAGVTTSIMTKKRILDIIDIFDCYPDDFWMKVFESKDFGKIDELDIHGAWHDFKNPLYIKLTRPDGSIAFDGYGTDH